MAVRSAVLAGGSISRVSRRSVLTVGLMLVGSMLAGCGSARTPGARRVAQLAVELAPIVTDVCSHVDQDPVAAILGVPTVHGVSSPKPAPLQGPPAQSCVFTPAEHMHFTVGLGPFRSSPRSPGPRSC
jgi:hypothetical protein